MYCLHIQCFHVLRGGVLPNMELDDEKGKKWRKAFSYVQISCSSALVLRLLISGGLPTANCCLLSSQPRTASHQWNLSISTCLTMRTVELMLWRCSLWERIQIQTADLFLASSDTDLPLRCRPLERNTWGMSVCNLLVRFQPTGVGARRFLFLFDGPRELMFSVLPLVSSLPLNLFVLASSVNAAFPGIQSKSKNTAFLHVFS